LILTRFLLQGFILMAISKTYFVSGQQSSWQLGGVCLLFLILSLLDGGRKIKNKL